MAYLQFETLTSTSFRVRAVGMDTSMSKSLIWFIDDDYSPDHGEVLSASYSVSNWAIFTGLTYGQEYKISVSIVYDDGYGPTDEVEDYWDTGGTTEDGPDLSSVSIKKSGSSNTTLSVYVAGLDSAYRWDVLLTVYYNGSLVDQQWANVSVGSSTSDVVTFTGLTSGTQYLVCIEDLQYYLNGSWISAGGDWSARFSTGGSGGSSGGEPGTFSWTYPKVAGEPFNITADEWNGLYDHINTVRTYKGLSAFDFLYVQPEDNFRAIHWNDAMDACKNAMDRINDSVFEDSKVNPGDPVSASELNWLALAVNYYTV